MPKKNKEQKKIWDLPKVLLLLGLILIGFLMRFLSFENVMTDNLVQLKGADAYFFARQASLISSQGDLPYLDENICYPDGYVNQREAILYPALLSFAGQFTSIETATAYLSPVLALLTTVVVVFMLLELFPGKYKAVLIGTSVISFTGIQYIARSYFGFGDRHVLEAFLLALGLLFLIKAWNKQSIKYGALSGIVFALYQLSWSQTSLLILLLTLAISLKYIFSKTISRRFTIINLIFLAMQLPSGIWSAYAQSIGITLLCILAILALHIINLKFRTTSSRLMLLSLTALILLILTVIFFRDFADKLWVIIWGFIGNRSNGPVVSEAQPMFTIYSNISLLPPSAVTFQVALFALSIYGLLKYLQDRDISMAVFGLSLALLALMRIRSEYYYVLFSALGLAYLVIKHPSSFSYILILLAGFLLTYIAAWTQDLQAQRSSLAFSNADYDMAIWMRENLPEAKERYGIMADWQLGYLYTYLADKPILAEPNFCNYLKPTEFFLLKDEAQARDMLNSLGIKYVLVKKIDLNKYYYFLSQTNAKDQFKVAQAELEGTKVVLYDQSYYQRMFVRMYNFNGQAASPSKVYTIVGRDVNEYPSFEEAVKSGSGNYYSKDENTPSIPLEKLQYFELIHTTVDASGGVKLFKLL
jgi:asparagine N-glycosylation enzyme membrane subunit Stt3